MKKKKVKFHPVIVTVKPDNEKYLKEKGLLERSLHRLQKQLGDRATTEYSLLQAVKATKRQLVELDCNVVNSEILFTTQGKLNRYLKMLERNYTDLIITYKHYKLN
tara:strand:- start:257 stop:574 length:318 start_codon:yes stop_codon:yes gene_type:complete